MARDSAIVQVEIEFTNLDAFRVFAYDLEMAIRFLEKLDPKDYPGAAIVTKNLRRSADRLEEEILEKYCSLTGENTG